MKKTFVFLLLLCLVFTPMHAITNAAYTPAAGEEAGNRMLGLHMLKGKYVDDALALKDEITRAELVTVIVRAFGQETNAALLNGAAAYPDTASHWASGNIAMAKALVEKAGGDAIGMPDGSFAPDSKLTPAQAVAFLMKFLGVRADATKAWPANYLDVAVEKNLITGEDSDLLAPMSNDNATRGLVFYLFDNAFSTYDLGGGKTFYTKYVDTTAPVLTINDYPKVTTEASVTISGKAEGATELTSSYSSSPTMDTNGQWSITVSLNEGTNTIQFSARDLAGNTASQTITILRNNVKSVQLTPSQISMTTGSSYTFKAVVIGLDDKPMADYPITWSASGGSIDSKGTFTSSTEGTFTITATAGDKSANAVAYISKPAPVYEPEPDPEPQLPSIILYNGNFTFDEGSEINVDFVDTPHDATSVHFHVDGALPPGIEISNDGYFISEGPIPYNIAGTYTVTITATAIGYQSASETYTWKINDATLVIESTTDYLTIDLLDFVWCPENTTLSFSLKDAPSKSTVTLQASGTLTVTTLNKGTDNFSVIVHDDTDPHNLTVIPISLIIPYPN